MPTYEYECEACGHRFELFQQMNDDPACVCPECLGPIRRLIGTEAGFWLEVMPLSVRNLALIVDAARAAVDVMNLVTIARAASDLLWPDFQEPNRQNSRSS